MATIYRLKFSSGKSYIGATVNLKKRIAAHRSNVKHGHHKNLPIYRAWKKFGEPEIISIKKVKICRLEVEEILAIRLYKTMLPNGYNATPGGKDSPMLVPEIAARMIGNEHTKGFKHSEETLRKMRLKKLNPLQIEKFAKYWIGKKRPESAKERIRGDKNPMRRPEVVSKFRGRKLSKRTKQNMSDAQKLRRKKELENG